MANYRLIGCLAVVTSLFILLSSAAANDSTAVMAAGGLKFEKSDELSLLSEVLSISPTLVTVDYQVQNISDKKVKTIIAFPLPRLEGPTMANLPVEVSNTSLENFVDFKTKIDNTEIEPKLEAKAFRLEADGRITDDVTSLIKEAEIFISPLDRSLYDKLTKLPKEKIRKLLELKLIYPEGSGNEQYYTPLWAVNYTYYVEHEFLPKKEVTIHHEYSPVVGRSFFAADDINKNKDSWCIDASTEKALRKLIDQRSLLEYGTKYIERKQVDYVLKTGANWAGPIKKFTLIINKQNQDDLVSLCASGVKKTTSTRFQLIKHDFVPKEDLSILFFEARKRLP